MRIGRRQSSRWRSHRAGLSEARLAIQLPGRDRGWAQGKLFGRKSCRQRIEALLRLCSESTFTGVSARPAAAAKASGDCARAPAFGSPQWVSAYDASEGHHEANESAHRVGRAQNAAQDGFRECVGPSRPFAQNSTGEMGCLSGKAQARTISISLFISMISPGSSQSWCRTNSLVGARSVTRPFTGASMSGMPSAMPETMT